MKILTFTFCCFIAFINLYSITANNLENTKNLKKNVNEKSSAISNNGSELLKNSSQRPDLNINFNTNFMVQITNKGSIVNSNNNKNIILENKKEEKSNDSINKIAAEDFKKDKSAASNNNKKSTSVASSNKKKASIDKFARSGRIVCSSENCLSPNICSENKDYCLCAFENAEVFSLLNFSNQENKSNLHLIKNKIDVKNENDLNDNKSQNYVYCEYKRKSTKIFLLLELFFNIGIGHIYVGNFKVAKLKIIILSLPWLIYAFLLFKRKVILDDNNSILNGLPILFYILWVLWWLYDLVNIFRGKFKDDYGVSLI